MSIPSEYRISLDHADLQLEVIHGFLSTAYWCPGIPLAVVAQAARHSLVAGAYHASGDQVGFARMATDHATFGYLADVFVIEKHRGKGLARAMTLALLDLPEVRRFRRVLLATRDAHGVYEACGFERVANPELFMQIARKDLYANGEPVDQREPSFGQPEGEQDSTPISKKPKSPYRLPLIRIEEAPELLHEEMTVQESWPLPGLAGAFYRALLINRK